MPPGTNTFGLYNSKTGEATSAKTLNTLTMTYVNDPQKIMGD